MQARQLAQPYPTVRMDTNAVTAARLIIEVDHPALIVVDANERPLTILPASQVMRMLMPLYVQDDPTLARVLDEGFADHICDLLAQKSVRDLVGVDRPRLPVVAPDDTMLEVAAIMAANRCPLVAVVDGHSEQASIIGAISASQLLAAVLPDA